MESDWVKDRYRVHGEQKDKQRLREAGKSNALNALPSMFQQLKAQVEEDVKYYNASFSMSSADKECLATTRDFGSGFKVAVGPKSVEVDRPSSGTVIEITYLRTDTDFLIPPKKRRLEVVDDDGLKFLHDKELLDEHGASLVILDPILCGGRPA